MFFGSTSTDGATRGGVRVGDLVDSLLGGGLDGEIMLRVSCLCTFLLRVSSTTTVKLCLVWGFTLVWASAASSLISE